MATHVYLLSFDTQYELCMSFVRMQEFYESQKFRGKYFTLEQYVDYWSQEFGHGSFTYPSVWNGFNIPGDVLCKWMNKFSEREDDLRSREIAILKAIRKLMKKEMGFTLDDDIDKIYVIGVHRDNDNRLVVNHELAHAMYRLSPEYRKKCKYLLRKVDKKIYEETKNLLIKKGYCDKVIDDEMQAYFSTTGKVYHGADSVLNGRKEFERNFKEFSEKNN